MRELWMRLWYVLSHRTFLWLLLIVNAAGTVYGYIWYGAQLSRTEPLYYIFVPDSPTASLFFCIAIIGWLRGTNYRFIEVLAFITLIKYGLWADVMNMLTWYERGTLSAQGWMLVASHFAMALQAVLYIPKYNFGFIAVIAAAIWTLHNDVIDYVFGQMPSYPSIAQYANEIGYFTFWLSISCIVFALYVSKQRGLFAHMRENR